MGKHHLFSPTNQWCFHAPRQGYVKSKGVVPVTYRWPLTLRCNLIAERSWQNGAWYSPGRMNPSKNWMGPYQRTPEEVARATGYSRFRGPFGGSCWGFLGMKRCWWVFHDIIPQGRWISHQPKHCILIIYSTKQYPTKTHSSILWHP